MRYPETSNSGKLSPLGQGALGSVEWDKKHKAEAGVTKEHGYCSCSLTGQRRQ